MSEVEEDQIRDMNSPNLSIYLLRNSFYLFIAFYTVQILKSVESIAVAADNVNALENLGWRCTGCPEISTEKDSLYLQVKHALDFSDRLSFIPLETNWIDDLIASSSVHIMYSPFCTVKLLNDFSSMAHFTNVQIEKFQMIVCKVITQSSAAVSSNQDTSDVMIERYRMLIDDFLAINPCWFPLKEPRPQTFGRNKYPVSSDELLILIRFPRHGFLATCMLYEAIVARQFPKECIYTKEEMSKFEIASIGKRHIY